MELKPTSGKPAVPVPVEKKSSGWRQVMVPAPEGSFTVRAADDGQSWLAFTWPRELAAGGYFARRFQASGAALMIAGILGLLAGIAMSLKDDLQKAARLGSEAAKK
jgi:predicted phage tail protein